MEPSAQPSPDGHDFYRAVIEVLRAAGVEFLVGGAYALRVHAGIKRDTKDFDLLARAGDVEAVLEVVQKAGFSVELTYPHWLAKVRLDAWFIDIIFRSGNGLCDVDDEWFHFASTADILGLRLPVCPAEEMLWQKAYIMERERFDGADVQHLLRSCGRTMDWPRLLRRFGADWPVLLSHLVLFNFVFPGERECVPRWILNELADRLREEEPPGVEKLCRGTLLSRLQYLDDVEQGGYVDARTAPEVQMNETELRQWTAAAREQAAHGGSKEPAPCQRA